MSKRQIDAVMRRLNEFRRDNAAPKDEKWYPEQEGRRRVALMDAEMNAFRKLFDLGLSDTEADALIDGKEDR